MRLSNELGIPVATEGMIGHETIRLVVTGDRLEIRARLGREQQSAWVDLSRPIRRARGHLSRRQPLARALGRKLVSVVDATAGFGGDTALLACLGYQVTAIERCPLLVALLQDGLRRAAADPRSSAIAARIKVVGGDACEQLPRIDPPPEAVYLDPMFPPKQKKSALARKEVRLVRRIVGDDADAASLLAVARRCAARRVIVKRPLWPGADEPLAADPAASHGGKLVRYDVYLAGAP